MLNAKSKKVANISDSLSSVENLNLAVKNFTQTLSDNPSLSAVIKPQLDSRIKERNDLVLKLTNSLDAEFVKKETDDEITRKINEFKIVLGNLKNTLSENPSLSGILEPQITLKQEEMNAMMNQLSDLILLAPWPFQKNKLAKNRKD